MEYRLKWSKSCRSSSSGKGCRASKGAISNESSSERSGSSNKRSWTSSIKRSGSSNKRSWSSSKRSGSSKSSGSSNKMSESTSKMPMSMMRSVVMSGMVILVTILITMSVAHMQICRGMMVVGGRMVGLMMIWLMVVGGWMIGLMMMRLGVIRVYMVRLRGVDAVMVGQGAEAVKLRAVSMNFPKKSKVRPG